MQASAVDGRTVTELGIAAFLETRGMDRVALDEAIAALNLHRAEKPGVWVEPGHILAGVRRIRDERERAARMARPVLEQKITLDPDKHRADVEAARRWFRDHPGATDQDYLDTLGAA